MSGKELQIKIFSYQNLKTRQCNFKGKTINDELLKMGQYFFSFEWCPNPDLAAPEFYLFWTVSS